MEYYSPTDLNEAYSLLEKYGDDAIPIAGSTFYMGHREELFDEVEAVINIKQLGLSYIRQDSDGLHIGATTTLNDIFTHELTRQGAFGILATTVQELNINEIRNMATIGGEVCIAGEVDMPTTLLAYDANIFIGNSKAVRKISLADFHIGYLNNALEQGEMVLEVQIPQPPVNSGGGFAKFERTAADLPIANVATRISLDSAGICTAARVVAGAATLSGVPERSSAAEALLLNQAIDGALIKEVAAAAADIECVHDFRASREIRRLWVKCGVEDALERAVAVATGEQS